MNIFATDSLTVYMSQWSCLATGNISFYKHYYTLFTIYHVRKNESSFTPLREENNFTFIATSKKLLSKVRVLWIQPMIFIEN